MIVTFLPYILTFRKIWYDITVKLPQGPKE